MENSELKKISINNIKRIDQFKDTIKEDIIHSMNIELKMEKTSNQSLILQHNK